MSLRGWLTRNYSKLSWGLFIVVALAIGLNSYKQEGHLVRASFRLLNEAQFPFWVEPIPDYHIIVDVERPTDRRRTEVVVEGGEITQATVKFWLQDGFGWDEPYDLNEEQAYPFTIPGLFDMLRGALNFSEREEILVDMKGEPPFPQRIKLGPVWRDGSPVFGTESTIIVREFEIIR